MEVISLILWVTSDLNLVIRDRKAFKKISCYNNACCCLFWFIWISQVVFAVAVSSVYVCTTFQSCLTQSWHSLCWRKWCPTASLSQTLTAPTQIWANQSQMTSWGRGSQWVASADNGRTDLIDKVFLVIIPYASTKLKGGYTGFTLSVCDYSLWILAQTSMSQLTVQQSYLLCWELLPDRNCKSIGLWYWELMSHPDPAVLPVGTLHSLEWFWVSRKIFVYSHHNTIVFSSKMSICGQNRVCSVSSTILVRSILYLHILSSNFRRCIMFVAKFKNLKFWQIL